MGVVYKITNAINGKVYVGKTEQSLGVRYKRHLWHVQKGTNRYLYDAMRCYGVENFVIEVIEEASATVLNEREVYWIATLGTSSHDKGYNMTNGGDGGCMPPESIAKMVAKKTGMRQTEAHKQAISRGNKGIVKPVSEASKIKISQTLKRKIASGEVQFVPPAPRFGPAHPKYVDVDLNKLVELIVGTKLSLDVIAEQLGVSRTTITYKIQKAYGKTAGELRKQANATTGINSEDSRHSTNSRC